MERVWTNEVHLHVGERVRLCGWLHNLRRMGRINFLVLRDGVGTFQVLLDQPDQVDKLKGLQAETVLEIIGTVAEEPRAPGGLELHDCEVTIISPVTEPTPFEINKKVLKPGLDVFLDYAPIGLRHLQKRALFRAAAIAINAYREFLTNAGFVEIQTPKIVGTATEGGANVFAIDYFGQPAYLAQSPQLYKQIMVGVFERVFEVGPVFRAEPHSTARHTNEYVSLDVEMGFIQDHRDVMRVLSQTIRHVVARLREAGDLIEQAWLDLPDVPSEIPSVKFRVAQEIISKRYSVPSGVEMDLSPAEEELICRYAQEEWGSEFVFVTHYPAAKRPFYTMPDPTDPEHTHSFDLLFRGCEITTGGQRIHLYSQLVESMARRGLSVRGFEGYLQAFKYGMPPHGGFGMGLERLMMQFARLSNLREATLFPRDMTRLSP